MGERGFEPPTLAGYGSEPSRLPAGRQVFQFRHLGIFIQFFIIDHN